MSVEVIAESLLRKSAPTNSYLKRWVRQIASADQRDPAYSVLKFERVRWITRKPFENDMDKAIYALTKALVLFRQDNVNDTPLSNAVLEYEAALRKIAGKKASSAAYRTMMIRKRLRQV
jgi:hypothetical protein